jgi:solute carrier family 41
MVVRFEGIAVFQPVINGVGGNLVAVQASRISTALHRDAQLGSLADDDTVIFITPAAGFFGKGRLFICQQIDSNIRKLWL